MIVGVEAILDKAGCRCQHLVTRVQQGLEDDVEGTGSPTGHDDLIARYGDPLFFGQVIGNGNAHLRVAGLGHIAVVADPARIHRIAQDLVEGVRWRQVGITQAEIKDPLHTVFGLEPGTRFKHLANPGRLGHHVVDLV